MILPLIVLYWHNKYMTTAKFGSQGSQVTMATKTKGR